ncbi:arginine-ornithine antiporter [Enterococcus villorum]|uniref:Arginine-ornithine antiporter n=2 Tax=Enterococcus villorum TaxID=112904 RepID=A0A511J267_9ENTE|nr:arginine-ornithine antiporter [Enterococcus villorum]EOH92521.1 arginine/ornithine antiporter [Enterococcus villorum ATCC 700913]EOW75624.1 arginine/ornithine antiporter [Enterococcus villorum ATCC 700913]GEL92044.1 arginine-ornithine antiporter [Enterococcus villorum]
MEKKTAGISKWGLVALVVSSSIGSGVFGITSDLASAAAPGPAIISWVIVGIGILALVLSLNHLGEKRPDLDGGIFGYAKASFGELGGFISGWGYWLSAWLGNVAFATMMMSAIGEFFPLFKGGQNIPSILFASMFIWGLTFLVNNGIESASFINMIVTICKLVPLFLFIVFMIVAFKLNVFTADFWGNVSDNLMNGAKNEASIWLQIKGCLMVMMWVFVGIEGASVLANRAKKRSDAQQATIIGLLCLLFIYILASLLPYGVLSQSELASISQPAMANILKGVVGSWGAMLINIGLIISIIGSWLSWTMLPAETTMLMAKDGLLPKFWGKTNSKKAPTYSLVLTAALTNLFLLTFLFTDYAYQFAYSLCTAAILICYLLVGIYQVQFSFQQKDHKQMIIGGIAVVFELMGITLAGFSYVLLCSIAYLPGFYFYWKACQETNHQISTKEKIMIGLMSSGAILSIILLVSGIITI